MQLSDLVALVRNLQSSKPVQSLCSGSEEA